MDHLVEVESEAELNALEPDFRALGRVETRGTIVTARGSGDLDFVSRFFAPRAGVDEDPVTGSAHCCLGPYWGEKLSKSELRARQVSPRGGEVVMRLAGERVKLGGGAITVFEARLLT